MADTIAWTATTPATPATPPVDPIDADIKQWENDQLLLTADTGTLKDLLAAIKNGTCKLSPIELLATIMYDLTNIITDQSNMAGDMTKVTADLTKEVAQITDDIKKASGDAAGSDALAKDSQKLVDDVNKFQAEIKKLKDDGALDAGTYTKMSDAIQTLNTGIGKGEDGGGNGPFNLPDGSPPGAGTWGLQQWLVDPTHLGDFTTMTGTLNTNVTSISSSAQTMFKYDTDKQGQEDTALTNIFKSWSGQARSFVQNQKTQ